MQNKNAYEEYDTDQSSDEYTNRIQNMKLCLLDNEGRVVKSEEGKQNLDFCFKNFFELRKLTENKQSLLPNDVLSLRCEVYILSEIIWSRIEYYLNSPKLGTTATDSSKINCSEQDSISYVDSSFTNAMKSLCEDGTLSDVSLQTNTKSFPAHKCILSARSPVFKAMFSGDMKEKTGNCVEISDIEAETLQQLMFYIYTDTTGELLWRDAADLFRAADKYELLDLKKRCAISLISDISVSNVCTILTIADMHHDQELLETAQDFLMQQEADFFTSDEWINFKKDNYKLYVKILELLFVNMKKH